MAGGRIWKQHASKISIFGTANAAVSLRYLRDTRAKVRQKSEEQQTSNSPLSYVPFAVPLLVHHYSDFLGVLKHFSHFIFSQAVGQILHKERSGVSLCNERGVTFTSPAENPFSSTLPVQRDDQAEDTPHYAFVFSDSGKTTVRTVH